MENVENKKAIIIEDIKKENLELEVAKNLCEFGDERWIELQNKQNILLKELELLNEDIALNGSSCEFLKQKYSILLNMDFSKLQNLFKIYNDAKRVKFINYFTNFDFSNNLSDYLKNDLNSEVKLSGFKNEDEFDNLDKYLLKIMDKISAFEPILYGFESYYNKDHGSLIDAINNRYVLDDSVLLNIKEIFKFDSGVLNIVESIINYKQSKVSDKMFNIRVGSILEKQKELNDIINSFINFTLDKVLVDLKLDIKCPENYNRYKFVRRSLFSFKEECEKIRNKINSDKIIYQLTKSKVDMLLKKLGLDGFDLNSMDITLEEYNTIVAKINLYERSRKLENNTGLGRVLHD